MVLALGLTLGLLPLGPTREEVVSVLASALYVSSDTESLAPSPAAAQNTLDGKHLLFFNLQRRVGIHFHANCQRKAKG